MFKMPRAAFAPLLVLATCSSAGAYTPLPVPPDPVWVETARRVVAMLEPSLSDGLAHNDALFRAVDTWLRTNHPQPDDLVRRAFLAKVEQHYLRYFMTPDDSTISLAMQRFNGQSEGELRDFIAFLETPSGISLRRSLADSSIQREQAVRRVTYEFAGLYKEAEESVALLNKVNAAAK